MGAFVFSQSRSHQAGTGAPFGAASGAPPSGPPLRRPGWLSSVSVNPAGAEHQVPVSGPDNRLRSRARMRPGIAQLFFGVPASQRDGTHSAATGRKLAWRKPGRRSGMWREYQPYKTWRAVGPTRQRRVQLNMSAEDLTEQGSSR